MHADPLPPTSPGMANHQKAEDGDLKLSRGVAPHLDVPPVAPPAALEPWPWALAVPLTAITGWEALCKTSIRSSLSAPRRG